MAKELASLTKEIVAFRDARDWKQFHNLKDLSLALSIEASEVNELFLWKKNLEVNRKELEGELADVFIYTLLLANEAGIDIIAASQKKMKANGKRYPVKKSKGSSKKYSSL